MTPADKLTSLIAGPPINAPADELALLTKEQLAQRLNMSSDGVLKLVAMRQLPAIKLGHRTLRFSWPDVQRALAKLTISEMNR